MDLRVRLLGRALRRVSVARLDDEALARFKERRLGHNPAVDLLLGGVARGVELTDTTAAGQVGPVPVRVHRPVVPDAAPLPLVVEFHGGGWTVGSLDMADWLCSNVAAQAGVVVVSVDYRLAPADHWPAAAEDCYAALVDLVARAPELGADPERVAVMGDSAGGNLSAVVSLMARDRGGPRIALQGLLYPATDLTLSSP
ncbi:MAG TPA: alpha/beta hydrolase fold domain-containing protein, partial [Actinomycetales bacterium]|nr:alpha/beta hydrolase fold domain-containing protein [Actinomycetales bacterium]